MKRWEVTTVVCTCWTKTKTMEILNNRKSFVEPGGMNGSNFKTNDFLSFNPFIVSVFVQHVQKTAATSHLFTPLFMFTPPPTYWFTSRLRLVYWSTLKIENDLPNFAFDITWLSLLYKFTRSFSYLFLSDEGPTLETLDFTIRIRSTPAFSNFDLWSESGWSDFSPKVSIQGYFREVRQIFSPRYRTR